MLLNRMVCAGFWLEQPVNQTAAPTTRPAAKMATIHPLRLRLPGETTSPGFVLKPDWNAIRANLA
jgi:hypothetical protein